jgi:hypothetical protein
MPAHLKRRQILGASAAVALGLGAGALGATGQATAANDDAGRDPRVSLPPVPGMLGDRRANEMWYQLDQDTLYDPVPGIIDAYLAINDYAADFGGVDAGPLVVWLQDYNASGYPGTYREWAAPITAPLTLISRTLLHAFDRFYARRGIGLIRAFTYFAEGVLYDPRRPEDPIHSMDGVVPIGYPVWHAYARAMMLLNIDAERWREVLPVLGYGCALQLIAKPDQTKVNPPQPTSVILKTAAKMLPMNVNQLDAFYQTFPYPPLTEPQATASLFGRKLGK